MSMDQALADDEDLKVIVNRMSAREVNKDVVKNWEEEMDGKSKREDTEIKKKIKVSMKHERIGMFSVVRKMVVMCWNKEKMDKLSMVMRVGKYELWFNELWLNLAVIKLFSWKPFKSSQRKYPFPVGRYERMVMM